MNKIVISLERINLSNNPGNIGGDRCSSINPSRPHIHFDSKVSVWSVSMNRMVY